MRGRGLLPRTCDRVSEADELREAHEYARGVVLELMHEPTTRAALFRALDSVDKDSPHREPLTELARCAVVLRSLHTRIRDLGG